MISIRTLREGEPMPQHLGTGYETMPVMNSFIWVAEKEGRIIGILMAAPCHGLILLMRLCIEEGSNHSVAHLLFRHCMRDSEKMGFRGYFSYVSTETETERSLIAICRKAHGLQVPQLHVPLVGSIKQAGKF
jgi:hypothetical protein